jgi:hypothetical protein
MYCVQCGVKLADSEKRCPLCGLDVYHPQLQLPSGKPTYPPVPPAGKSLNVKGALSMITFLCLLVCGALLFCNLKINHEFSWSAYAMGGIGFLYVVTVLPWWFQKPNPVVFVPLSFATAMGLLVLINGMTQGDWFLSFAFPCFGGIALLITAVVALCRYLKRGRFLVFGGAFIALGCFMMLIEFFGHLTFGGNGFSWCFYPLGCCCAVGIFLLVAGCSTTLRDWLKRKLFL